MKAALCPWSRKWPPPANLWKLSPAEGSKQLDPEVLRRLYTYMLKCRIVEERIRILYRQGKFAGNYFAAVGQEATEVGATLDLLPEDAVAAFTPQFRDEHHEGHAVDVVVCAYLWTRNEPRPGAFGAGPLRVCAIECHYAVVDDCRSTEYRYGYRARLQDAAESRTLLSRSPAKAPLALAFGTKR